MKNPQKNSHKKILAAVCWPYVNGNIHIGHLAGYLLPADIVTRYQRMKGNDVLMVSGSDCHGTPITVEADKTGKTPAEIVEYYHKRNLDLWEQYDLQYSLYTKTTTETHKRITHEIFLALLKNGYIIKGKMQQYYSPSEDKFLPDRYVEGTCPHCGAEGQRSDQCENCGRWLKDGELINPVSKLSGEKVELKDTEHYFLNFPKLTDELKEYVKPKEGVWRDWVYKESKGWLDEGLQKRAITRDMDWAIPLPIDQIPEDQKIENIENKRIYVWFEAVLGYTSAAVEWSERVSEMKAQSEHTKENEFILRLFKGQSKDWKEWWLNPDAEIYNFVGQDNLIFHTLMWPGELIGSKKGYTLPHNVVISKFMNFNEAKFSKSRGNIINSKDIADEFGVDSVRYFISANLPENKESNFTWERFIDSVNNELVANLGNFINRSLVFYANSFLKNGLKVLENKELLDGAGIEKAFEESAGLIEEVKLVNALNRIMELSSVANKYFNDSKIWELVKDESKHKEAGEHMHVLLNFVEALRILIYPFMPHAHTRLSKMTGRNEIVPEVGVNSWEFTPVKEFELKGVEPLFRKIDMEAALKKLENA